MFLNSNHLIVDFSLSFSQNWGMKNFLLISICLVALAGCGSDSASSSCSSSPLLGTWTTSGQTTIFASDCTWSNSTCHNSGTYPATTATSGTVTIHVTSVQSGAPNSCLDLGAHSCTYSINNGTLSYICS